MNAKASSPSSTGPAGPEFEVSVGAFYNLSMLAGATPRGLPGTIIERVVLQRAAEGHPLDDVIVKAKTSDGSPATLEIQAKRSLDFTPKDEEWRKVVAQIVQVSRKPEFKAEYYEMAIALAQTSKKISGPYQAVLCLARELEDAHTFFVRFTPSGSANKDMCTFVSTFKARVVEAGGSGDNETIWQLLRRLQILVFDFGVPGSGFEHSAVERAASILHHGQKQQARVLWDALISLTLHAAANGGGFTRSELIMELTHRSFRFSGHPNYTFAQDVLSNDSDCALANIKDQIGAFTLTRHGHLAAIRDALGTGRYIEICGEPGVGKSGLLKHYALQVGEARALVLSPDCVIEGGWTGMQIALKIEGTAVEFLSDLASQGRNIIFLDNLNFFNESARKTVIDLIRAAATIQSIYVISTARRDFGNEDLSWLPSKALESLGHVVLPIGALSKTEVEELQRALPNLSPLLVTMHPAREAQTLFRLAYLAKRPKKARVFFSEAEMANEWWETVDGMAKEQRRESQRVLKVIIKQALIHLGPINISECPASTVDLLIERGILHDLGNDRVVFDHDVFCEWGIANFLHTDPEAISLLRFERPARSDLARSIEILSRIHLEVSDDFSQWKLLFNRVSQEKVHDTWRRAALLGLVRSEMADTLFQNQDVTDFLLANDEKVLQELMGVLISIETRPAIEVWPAVGIPKEKIPKNFHSPIGPAWERIITWLQTIDRKLSEKTTVSVIRLYIFWCEGTFGKGPHFSSVLRSLYQWLIEIEMACRFENSVECPEPFGCKLDFHDRKKLASELRMTFFVFCDEVPNLAVEYLQTLRKQRRGDEAVVSVLTFRGMLAKAASRELAELTLDVLIQKKDSEGIYEADPLREPFALEWFFTPPSPARGPFLELLVYAPQHGLNLVRQLVARAASFLADKYSRTDVIILDFLDGPRELSCVESYSWSRGTGYATVASALMALEA
ncbi:MAG TPA: hypothetical protein VGO47_10880, partial [Chlamydiales bacterium]|nr:hypothetical protein [Chlamydiales bacterium]